MPANRRNLWAIGYARRCALSSATDLTRKTLRKGRQETPGGEAWTGRIRVAGAWPPPIQEDRPALLGPLEALVDPRDAPGPDIAAALDVPESREAPPALTEHFPNPHEQVQQDRLPTLLSHHRELAHHDRSRPATSRAFDPIPIP